MCMNTVRIFFYFSNHVTQAINVLTGGSVIFMTQCGIFPSASKPVTRHLNTTLGSQTVLKCEGEFPTEPNKLDTINWKKVIKFTQLPHDNNVVLCKT